MKKALTILALSLSLLSCRDLSLLNYRDSSIEKDLVIKTNIISSDKNVISKLMKNTPEGYTLLGDVVSGWNYVCTSPSCGNGTR